jgi:hypothetical protein
MDKDRIHIAFSLPFILLLLKYNLHIRWLKRTLSHIEREKGFVVPYNVRDTKSIYLDVGGKI